jgi:hypothetical protein
VVELNNNGDSYFRRLSSMDEFDRPVTSGYYTDDEIENLWTHAFDDDDGELIFGEV